MKKVLIIVCLLIATSVFAQFSEYTTERYETIRLKNNAGAVLWQISGAADDTSQTFPRFSEQAIQYGFWDRKAANDSMYITIQLLTSNHMADSTFKVAQTIVTGDTTRGWRPSITLDAAMTMYGKLVVTGTAANSDSLDGYITMPGWSNAEGMAARLR